MKDLTKGKPSKLIFLFALPMLVGNIFQQLYNIVDSFVVGNYIGEAALAAVGASFPVIYVLIALVIGVSMGGTIVVSQYFGAKDFENVKKAIDTMFVFVIIASVLITIMGLVFSGTIFKLLNLPEEILPDAKIYLNIYFSGFIFLFGYNAVAAALRGLGDSKTPLYFLIISTIINLFLDLLFVVGFGWGVASVAVATVISQGIALVISLIYLNKYNKFFKFSISNMKFDMKIFKDSVRIGVPSGLQQTFVGLGMLALLRIVNDFGTDAIAAYTVAGRIDSFAAMPAMTFSAALSTFVGQNIGANKTNRISKGYWATWKITSLISLIVMVLVFLFSGPLMSIFTDKQEVISIGQSYLTIVCSFYILFSTMFVTNGVLRGAGDTLLPMFFTLLSLWLIRVPLAYVLSRPNLNLNIEGIWWAIPIAWFVGCALSVLYYLTGKWKRKAVVKPTSTHILAEVEI